MGDDEGGDMKGWPIIVAIASGLCLVVIYLLIFQSGKGATCLGIPHCRGSEVYQLYSMVVGYWIVPQNFTSSTASGKVLVAEPITSYLLNTTVGWILIDTGLEPAVNDSNGGSYFESVSGSYPFAFRVEQQTLAAYFQEIGITYDNISHVILTNMRRDKTGGLKLFTQAQIYVSAAEYAFATSSNASSSPLYQPVDYAGIDSKQWNFTFPNDSTRIRSMRLCRGAEIAFTPGVTPGLQAVMVDLKHNRSFVITGDTVHLETNLASKTLPGVVWDESLAKKSLSKVEAWNKKEGVRVLVPHDPAQVAAYKLAPFYLT